jgi:hypothetical protein
LQTFVQRRFAQAAYCEQAERRNAGPGAGPAAVSRRSRLRALPRVPPTRSARRPP